MKNALIGNACMAFLTASLGFATASAGAQEAGSRQTREFLQATASSDQFEILEAETVLAQTANAEVKAFAARMLQDHRQLSQATRDAAVRSGLKPPEMAMSADQAQWLGALQSASGSEFDKLYLRQQVLAHTSALTVERMYAKSGDDAALRSVATSALPVIASHGDMASQMEAKLGRP